MADTHNHSHHAHHHHHPPHADGSKSLAVAFFLNLGFALIEFIGGLLSNSVSILSDAVHDLGDSIALGMAWRYERISQKGRDLQYTYGYRRFSIFGALITIVILVVGSLGLFIHSVQRLLSPEDVRPDYMMALAVLGLAVNGFAALRVMKDTSHSHQAVGLHLLEDVLGWAVVLIGAVVIHFTGLMWIDPVLSIGINLFILWKVKDRIKMIVPIIMQSAPLDMNIEMIKKEIKALPLVQDVHSVQAWSLDGQRHVMSCHIVVNDNAIDNLINLKKQTKDLLLKHNIMNSTLEYEFEHENCIN